jgi:hypothetical protein
MALQWCVRPTCNDGTSQSICELISRGWMNLYAHLQGKELLSINTTKPDIENSEMRAVFYRTFGAVTAWGWHWMPITGLIHRAVRLRDVAVGGRRNIGRRIDMTRRWCV